MNYSRITLGELLSSKDDIIRRNAVSILKRYQKENIKAIEKCSTSWCKNDSQLDDPKCPACATLEYYRED